VFMSYPGLASTHPSFSTFFGRHFSCFFSLLFFFPCLRILSLPRSFLKFALKPTQLKLNHACRWDQTFPSRETHRGRCHWAGDVTPHLAALIGSNRHMPANFVLTSSLGCPSLSLTRSKNLMRERYGTADSMMSLNQVPVRRDIIRVCHPMGNSDLPIQHSLLYKVIMVRAKSGENLG
jgi:hypothetical protein